MKKKFPLLGPLLLLLAACNSNDPAKQQSPPAVTATPTTTPTTATPNNIYIAAVNDLRIRETPTLDGKVLLQLQKGAQVDVTGKKSAEKVTVELNGKKITDVFYEVNLARGGQGWVFGGALTTETTNTTASQDGLITNENGITGIHKTSTEADLIKLFGKENVVHEKEIYANGDVPPFKGFAIFKDKPNELLLCIDPENKKNEIDFAMIRQKGGKWHTNEGVKVGTTLTELTTINGKPFLFSGLGWDYGGYINDFQKGKLYHEKSSISFRLMSQGEVPPKFSGDITCKSDAPELKKATIFVGEITVDIK